MYTERPRPLAPATSVGLDPGAVGVRAVGPPGEVREVFSEVADGAGGRLQGAPASGKVTHERLRPPGRQGHASVCR